MVRIATPDSPRSVVLGTVLDALNHADGHSRRFHGTTRAQYRDAVLSALSATSKSPVAAALAAEAADPAAAGPGNVIPMRSRPETAPTVDPKVGPYTPGPKDPPRSLVLGAVVNAIAATDGDGRRARTVTVSAYVDTILSVLDPARATAPASEPTLGGGGQVVNLWPRGA